VEFPLWQLATPPAGLQVRLPLGLRTTSLDLEADGRRLTLTTADGAGKTALWLWNFADAPTALPLPPEAAAAAVHEVLFSRFSSAIYLLLEQEGLWRIVASTLEGGRLGGLRPVYKSQAPLRNLRTTAVRYNQRERLFFARAYAPERFQILSVRATGDLIYELTSPSGSATELTDASLRAQPPPPDAGEGYVAPVLPHVERAASALPLSIHSFNGMLTWQDEQGKVHERDYGGNYLDSREVKDAPPGTEVLDTANGFFRVRLVPGQPGVQLVRMTGALEAVVAGDRRLARLPAVAPTGRALVGVVRDEQDRGDRLITAAIGVKLAAARYLYSVGDDSFQTFPFDRPTDSRPRAAMFADLAQQGMQLLPTSDIQIYNTYEGFEYSSCHDELLVPLFASIDGYLEVLAAGFQAVFMVTEQSVSRPRLEKFLAQLQATAQREKLDRLTKIAEVTQRILQGDYRHPEAARVKKEAPAVSELHTVAAAEVTDFADCHPRGPYTATPELENYFRAFKYLNLLRLTAAEQEKLVGDAPLRAAWRAWVDTQKPFLSGSRHQLIFDPESQPPAYAQAECLPRDPPRLFPLAWGLDSEIWDRVVQHEDLPPSCGVAGRALPSGLDLLTVLGSPEAAAIQERTYAELPALRAAHQALKARLGRALPTALVPEAWLHLIQLLSTDRYVPEGVSAAVWRRRMLQTALTSWTNFRHTTVLINEEVGAECGGGEGEIFEELSAEPLRGAVDPVPAAWRQLAAVLDLLVTQARLALPTQGLDAQLQQCADLARAFASMAERQQRGEPLTGDEYELIQRYAGEIEHPYVALKSAVSRRSEAQEGGLSRPDPMTKIVDIARSGTQIWHMAVGAPIAVTVLLGDRGLLVPARGAVYSYYEVIADHPLDDEKWRSQLDHAARPPWTPPLAASNGK